MIEKTVKVSNGTGLDDRLSTMLVRTAGKYGDRIWITKGEKRANAKSIMGLMALAAGRGAAVTVGAEGGTEDDAVNELTDLLARV